MGHTISVLCDQVLAKITIQATLLSVSPLADAGARGAGDGRPCCCGRESHVLLVGAADLRHVLKSMASYPTSTHVCLCVRQSVHL